MILCRKQRLSRHQPTSPWLELQRSAYNVVAMVLTSEEGPRALSMNTVSWARSYGGLCFFSFRVGSGPRCIDWSSGAVK